MPTQIKKATTNTQKNQIHIKLLTTECLEINLFIDQTKEEIRGFEKDITSFTTTTTDLETKKIIDENQTEKTQ